jgi:RimJ/RimL family protein N-acetyltransferase
MTNSLPVPTEQPAPALIAKPMNEKTPTIRPLNENDASAFHAMRVAATINAPEGIASTQEEEAHRTQAETEARLRPTDHQIVFGAFDGDKLIGIVGLRREPHQKIAHKSLIWGVFVDPAYRRGGIARQLIENAIAHACANGALQIHLVVSAHNPRARNLYLSLGFTRYGVEPRGLFVNGRYLDDELMVLFLDNHATTSPTS